MKSVDLAAPLHAPVLGPEPQRLLFCVLLLLGQLEETHFGRSGRDGPCAADALARSAASGSGADADGRER